MFFEDIHCKWGDKVKKGVNTFSNIFLAPALLIYSVLTIIPVALTTWYSFTDWNGIGKQTFNMFMNYKDLVSDSNYWTSVKNTIILMVLALIIQIPFGLLFAYIVSRIKAGYKFFRSVYFLPVVVASAATATMFVLFFNSDIGPFNKMLDFIGLGAIKQNWLSDPNLVIYFVALPQVWQYIGIHFIIYLAAIQSIPEDIIESALIDGATGFRIFTRIVIPMLWGVIQVTVILCITGCLKAFDFSWIMTWGGPGYSSTYIAVDMFRTVFKEAGFGYGSSMAVSILIYSLILTVMFRKFVAREGKDQ